MTFSNAYEIIADASAPLKAGRESFDSLVGSFRERWLSAEAYSARRERHRNPWELDTELKSKLAQIIVDIQSRPEMQYVSGTSASYVTTRIKQIWTEDIGIRSLFDAVMAYCAETSDSYPVIAAHIAEYRAMNQLFNRFALRVAVRHTLPDIEEKRVRMTATVHKLPFHELESRAFERFTYAYAERRWQQVEWLGEPGGDEGRDIWVNDPGGTICLQCANYQKMQFSKAEDDMKRLVDRNHIPHKLITVCGGRVTAALRDKIKAYALSIGAIEAEVWSGAELDEKVRAANPEIIDRFFYGITRSEPAGQQTDFKNLLASHRTIFTNQFKGVSALFVDMPCSRGQLKTNTADIDLSNLLTRNVTIFGESGCGKSLFARKIASSFVTVGGIALVAEVKYYQATLQQLLNETAVSMGWPSLQAMTTTCKNYHVPVLIVVDGLNESAAEKQAKLLAEMSLMPVGLIWLLTSQRMPDVQELSKWTAIHCWAPDVTTKRAIATSIYGEGLPDYLEPILKVAHTCLEAAAVGSLVKEHGNAGNRFELLEVYIRSKLKWAESECMALLARLGAYFAEQVSFSVQTREVDAILAAGNHNGNILEACISAGLLRRQHTRISFSHEIFLDFFISESIVRYASAGADIIDAIGRPKHHNHRLWVAGAVWGTSKRAEFLSHLSDHGILKSIYDGQLGAEAELWLDGRFKAVLRKMQAETDAINFEIVDHEQDWIQPVQGSAVNWDSQEMILVHMLGSTIIQNKFLREVFDMTGDMDNKLKAAAAAFREQQPSKGLPFFAKLFELCYHEYGNARIALNIVFRGLSSGGASFDTENTITAEVIGKLTDNKPLSWGRLYLLLLICRHDECYRRLYGYVINVLTKTWAGAPYHVKMQVLESLPWIAEGEAPTAAAIEALQQIQNGPRQYSSRSMWINNAIIEALAALGALDDSLQNYRLTIEEEIRQVLANPQAEGMLELAASIYYGQFEEPLDGAYYEALGQLNSQQKTVLYQLALQGPFNSFFTVCLIKESAKLMGAECAPYLLKWTKDPFIESIIAQAAVSTFIISHILLGMFGYELTFDYTDLDAGHKAMLAVAELYYRINKNSEKDPVVDCRHALDILYNLEQESAMGGLWQVSHSCRFSQEDNRYFPRAIRHIYDFIGGDLAAIARAAISGGRQQLTPGSYDHTAEILQYAIALIGRYGTTTDIDLLRPAVDNPAYGHAALDAIKILSGKV